MAVNFNLLNQTGAGPANFYQGLMQGQEQQRVNALAQQKMAQEQEFNALRMQQTRGAISQQQRQEKAQNAAQKTAMFRERLLRAPNPNAVRELVKMQYADPDLGPILSQTGTLEQALAEVPDDPVQFERHRQQEALGMSEWMKSQLPKVVGNAIYKPAEDKFVAPERAPAPLGAPVAVMGPDGRPQYVSREQAIGMTPFTPASVKLMGGGGGGGGTAPMPKAPAGYRYTANNELEPIPGGPASPGLSPKDIQKREAVFPQATSSVKSFETKSEQFIKELEKLRDDPGLDQITGPIYGRTPSVSREGSRAQSLYDKIFAKGGFQALQDMRDASKTGGALGNVSNREGQQLTASFAAIDRKQDAPDVKEAINQAIGSIEGAKVRMQEAYDSTYAYKGDKAPATPSLSAIDQQALQWANSNPADPRSAAIKQRLGR